MKTYRVSIFCESIDVEATNVQTAVSRAIRQLKSNAEYKKLLKDRVGNFIKIDVERVK